MKYLLVFQLVILIVCFRVNAQSESSSLLNKKILISYVAYAPPGASLNTYDQCKSNFDFFLRNGVSKSENVVYIFSLVDDTAVPRRLSKLVRYSAKNIHFKRVKNQQLDLYIHGSVIRNHMIDSYDYYVFMNCGSRGPYYKTTELPQLGYYPFSKHKTMISTINWLLPFITRMQGTIGLVGPTISCEVSPHVQSYMMVARADAAKIIMNVWSTDKRVGSANRLDAIANTEVAASTYVLRAGIGIGCLDSRYPDIGGTYNLTCSMQYRRLGNSYQLNPTACRDVTSEGCARPVDPCEVVVVKYGGEMMTRDIVSPVLADRLKQEESILRKSKSSMCNNPVKPFGPGWDAEAIWHEIAQTHENRDKFMVDDVTELMVLIRGHPGYKDQLVSLLLLLRSLKRTDIRVIVIPTERDTYTTLYSHLQQAGMLHGQPTVSVLSINGAVYDTHASYLESLCTDTLKAEMALVHPQGEINRFCEVNSPLHYLLVDAALVYVKKYCVSCRYLLTTNADNAYSPLFFALTANNSDVIMANMISKGSAVVTKAKIAYVDLGSYLASVDFLRRTGVTFLSSVPARPSARNFHDADGHFITALIDKGAQVVKVDEYLFFHN